ncbi:MAG: hypothetical protein GYA17_06595, partial [Chloroflexi bacterium]|nr:hypothetical protein [Chloroflexota bacterium]
MPATAHKVATEAVSHPSSRKLPAEKQPSQPGEPVSPARLAETMLPHDVVALQQAAGNQAVAGYLTANPARQPAPAAHGETAGSVQRVADEHTLQETWKSLKSKKDATPFERTLLYIGDQVQGIAGPQYLGTLCDDAGNLESPEKDPAGTRHKLLEIMKAGFSSIFQRQVEKPIEQLMPAANLVEGKQGKPGAQRKYAIGFRSDDRAPEAVGVTAAEDKARTDATASKAPLPTNTGLLNESGPAPLGFTPKSLTQNKAVITGSGLDKEWNPFNPAFQAELAAAFGVDNPAVQNGEASAGAVPNAERDPTTKLMLFRNEIADNDLNTLISVAKNWRDCIRFPLFSDKVSQAQRVTDAPKGYPLRLDTHLYVVIVSQGGDTQSLQKEGNRFKEMAVRQIGGEHILAHFNVVRYYPEVADNSVANATFVFEMGKAEEMPWGKRTMDDKSTDPDGKIRAAYERIKGDIENRKGGGLATQDAVVTDIGPEGKTRPIASIDEWIAEKDRLEKEKQASEEEERRKRQEQVLKEAGTGGGMSVKERMKMLKLGGGGGSSPAAIKPTVRRPAGMRFQPPPPLPTSPVSPAPDPSTLAPTPSPLPSTAPLPPPPPPSTLAKTPTPPPPPTTAPLTPAPTTVTPPPATSTAPVPSLGSHPGAPVRDEDPGLLASMGNAIWNFGASVVKRMG